MCFHCGFSDIKTSKLMLGQLTRDHGGFAMNYLGCLLVVVGAAGGFAVHVREPLSSFEPPRRHGKQGLAFTRSQHRLDHARQKRAKNTCCLFWRLHPW